MKKFTTLAAKKLLSNNPSPSDVLTIRDSDGFVEVALTYSEFEAYRLTYPDGDYAIHDQVGLLAEFAVLNLVAFLKTGDFIDLDDEGESVGHPFNSVELIEIFECARLALADGDNFDSIVESCDLSDEYLRGLRDKLNAFMDSLKG